MTSIEVIVENFDNHPHCAHGPTILFSRNVNNVKRNFFACAACRNKKDCPFFLWENEISKFSKIKKKIWDEEKKKYLKNINHRKLFITLNKVLGLPENQRMYCHTCSRFEFNEFKEKHKEHELSMNITDYQLLHPSEMLKPLDDAKKEAQFLFAKSSVSTIVDILQDLKFKNVICIGTPRLHEYIQAENSCMNSILLDIDDRFHNFFGPLQFCWYNCFNNYFFSSEGKEVFDNFLQSSRPEEIVLVTDPPFGGRVEPLVQTIKSINNQFQTLCSAKQDMPVLWIFPYFMEPKIINSLPKYEMLDYKVDYDNHPLFQDGPKGRKQGSPVRIFTNIDLTLIKLPEDGYKFCEECKKWVSNENLHCKKCNACTSKDGRTYVHCNVCKRCVKPTWEHCTKCKRCAQTNHVCGELPFIQECFHCKEPGHKKRDCPKVNHEELHKKRKKKQLKAQKRHRSS